MFARRISSFFSEAAREISAESGRLAGALPAFAGIRAALVVLHLAKIVDWFHRLDFTSGLPIMNVDYVQFYGRALRAHHFLSESGRFWGYDPFDMAGYVSGPFLEVGVHFLSLVAHSLSPLASIETTLLTVEILGYVFAPFAVIAAVRNIGGSRVQAWSAFAVVTLAWGYLEPFSERMLRVGLWGFMMSGFLAVLQVSLAWRWLASGSWRVGALLCLVTAVLFQVHPASLVVIVVPNVVLFLAFLRRLEPARLAGTALFIALAVAANWYWIGPFAAFAEWKTDAPYFVTMGFKSLWRVFNPLRQDLFLAVRLTASVYMLGLAALAVGATVKRNRPLGWALAAWLAWLFFAGYFGSQVPVLQTLQPGRNEFPFWLVTAVAAGMAAPTVVLLYPRRRLFAGTLYVAFAALMFVDLPRPGRVFPPLVNRLEEGQMIFIDELKRRAPVDGRVMVECVDLLTPHFADLIPFLVPGQPLLGGQHPGNFILGRFSLFSSSYNKADGTISDVPIAFGRPVRWMGESAMRDYLRLFNVALVAARTPEMREALAQYPDLIGPGLTAGAYTIHEVKFTSTWFEEGSGRVRFALDRIVIDDASPGRIVLKSHWIKTLKCDPPAPIEPIQLMDDPAPFIAIDNSAGHRKLVVYNGGL